VVSLSETSIHGPKVAAEGRAAIVGTVVNASKMASWPHPGPKPS